MLDCCSVVREGLPLSGRGCCFDVTSLLRFHRQPGLPTVLRALQVYRKACSKGIVQTSPADCYEAKKQATVAELMKKWHWRRRQARRPARIYVYIYVYILAHVFGPSQTSPRFDGGLPLLLALWDYFLHLHLSLLCGVAKYEGIESVSQWSLDHLAPSRHLCGSDRSDSTTIAWSLSNMLLFIPWFKYYVTVNPWLQNLDHRFTSQITTSMSDIAPAEHCASILQEIVSRAKHHPGRARKAWQRMALVVASG